MVFSPKSGIRIKLFTDQPGVQFYSGNWQANDGVDAALNYADYYYLEALIRCKNLDN